MIELICCECVCEGGGGCRNCVIGEEMNVEVGLSARLNSVHECGMISVEETSVGIGSESKASATSASGMMCRLNPNSKLFHIDFKFSSVFGE